MHSPFDEAKLHDGQQHEGDDQDDRLGRRAAEILVYKVYNDGFRGQDLGGSAAQSVILMGLLILLTVVQFKFIERRVHY